MIFGENKEVRPSPNWTISKIQANIHPHLSKIFETYSLTQKYHEQKTTAPAPIPTPIREAENTSIPTLHVLPPFPPYRIEMEGLSLDITLKQFESWCEAILKSRGKWVSKSNHIPKIMLKVVAENMRIGILYFKDREHMESCFPLLNGGGLRATCFYPHGKKMV